MKKEKSKRCLSKEEAIRLYGTRGIVKLDYLLVFNIPEGIFPMCIGLGAAVGHFFW